MANFSLVIVPLAQNAMLKVDFAKCAILDSICMLDLGLVSLADLDVLNVIMPQLVLSAMQLNISLYTLLISNVDVT